MQTFLPVADFADSARLLDSPRLGKQRVETLQILRAIELPDYGWANHPAVLMWRGRTPALVAYGLAMARVWQERGFADSTATPDRGVRARTSSACRRTSWPRPVCCPSWLGDEELHRSHRSNLIAKDPAFYRRRFADRFGAEPDDLPYVWPPPDEVLRSRRRPTGVARVGRAAAERTTSSAPASPRGWSGWARSRASTSTRRGSRRSSCGRCPKELSGRRPAKDLRQLSAFLDEVAPGDRGGAADRARRRAAARRGRRRLPVPGARAAAAPPAGPVGPGRAADRRPSRRPRCRTRGRSSGSPSTRRGAAER